MKKYLIFFIIAGRGKFAYKAKRHEAAAFPKIKQKSGDVLYEILKLVLLMN